MCLSQAGESIKVNFRLRNGMICKKRFEAEKIGVGDGVHSVDQPDRSHWNDQAKQVQYVHVLHIRISRIGMELLSTNVLYRAARENSFFSANWR